MQALLQKRIKNAEVGILGGGYIGSQLMHFLRKCSNALDLSLKLTLLDRHNLDQELGREYDFFFNCAGNTGNFRLDPLKTVDSNIVLLEKLFRKLKVRRELLLLSSTRVYGFSGDPVSCGENSKITVDPLSLDFNYDGSKLLMENMAIHCTKNLSYRVKVARISNVFGHFGGLDESTMLKKMMLFSREGKACHVPENPESSRDYIYILDLLVGLLSLVISDSSQVLFNIGSGSSVSWRDIANGLNTKCTFDESKPVKHSLISIDKVKNETGFVPIFNVMENIKKIAIGGESESYPGLF